MKWKLEVDQALASFMPASVSRTLWEEESDWAYLVDTGSEGEMIYIRLLLTPLKIFPGL